MGLSFAFFHNVTLQNTSSVSGRHVSYGSALAGFLYYRPKDNESPAANMQGVTMTWHEVNSVESARKLEELNANRIMRLHALHTTL